MALRQAPNSLFKRGVKPTPVAALLPMPSYP
jgi:hypothetical protein